MAGSRTSPVLRDQWRTASDAKHHRNRDRPRPRGSRRDRGRGRPSDRGRFHPSRESGPDRLSRSSPPSRPFPDNGPEEPPSVRNPSPGPLLSRGSPGPHPGAKDDQGIHPSRLALVTDYQDLERRNPLPPTGPVDRRRDYSPSGHPPKRKRTRSPSPRSRRRNHPHHSKHGPGDRHFSHKKRGRFSGRGRAGRRSPRRGRDWREDEPDHLDRRSRSPLRGGEAYTPPPRSSRSPHPDDLPERDSRYRSASPRSFSGASRLSPFSRRNSKGEQSMNPTRPIQSIVDDSARSPSPPRPIPSFDADISSVHPDREAGIRETFPMHGMRGSEAYGNQRPRHRAHADTRHHASSPQYVTSADSFHGSPPPTSPYSGARGGRGGRGGSYHGQHGLVTPTFLTIVY